METGGPHGWGSEEWKELDFVLLEATTDDGLTGWGEGWSLGRATATFSALKSIVAPRLIGQEIKDVSAFTDHLLRESSTESYGVWPGFAISAANIALWDLAGKAAGQPLYRLLGKARHQRFPVFASLFRLEDPELVRKNCLRALSENMCWLKLHEDREDCIRAARDVAPDTELILDVTRGWRPEEASEKARTLLPYRLHWLEEPIDPPEDLESLVPFNSAGIPIALGENALTLDEFRRIIDSGAVTYLQPGITKMGGLEQVLRVLELGREKGVTTIPWQPHHGPALLAYLHLIATLEELIPVEFLYYESIAGPLYGDTLRPQGGFLHLPHTPGLGCDPDPEVLSAFAVHDA